MRHWDGGIGIFGLMSLVSNLFFLGLVVLAIVLLVRYLNRPGQAVPPAARAAGHPNAEEVLAERFARGEIDAEEYQTRLRILRGAGPTP